MQFLGFIFKSRDSDSERRSSSVYQGKPRSINMWANMSVLFLRQRKEETNRLLNFQLSVAGWLSFDLLSIGPDCLVESRNQFRPRLHVGDEYNRPASGLQQSHEAIVLLGAQLVQLQFGNVRRCLCGAVVVVVVRVVLFLLDVLLLHANQIGEQVANGHNEADCAEDRNDGKHVLFAQIVAEIFDQEQQFVDHLADQALCMLVEQVL